MKLTRREWLGYLASGFLVSIVFLAVLWLALGWFRKNGNEIMDSFEKAEVQEVVVASVLSKPVVVATAKPVETVTLYDVPMDKELQLFIIGLCEEKRIDPAIVLAMIERESRFKADVIGDNGKSFGLMQIMKHYHLKRMDKLGVTDLLDPYQNVTVGVDYLLEMLERYNGDVECALMAYNAGNAGAYKYWFSKGVYSNAYSQGVLEMARTLRGGATEHEGT